MEKRPAGAIGELIEVAIIIAATLTFEPVAALILTLTILVGVLFAWLMSRARGNDAPISIIDRKATR